MGVLISRNSFLDKSQFLDIRQMNGTLMVNEIGPDNCITFQLLVAVILLFKGEGCRGLGWVGGP